MKKLSVLIGGTILAFGMAGLLSTPALCLSTPNVDVLDPTQTYNFSKGQLVSETSIRLLQEKDGFGFSSAVRFDFVFFNLPHWQNQIGKDYGPYTADDAPNPALPPLGSGVSDFFGAENINSYLVHFDPGITEPTYYIDATIDFKTERILAIIVSDNLLNVSDGILGNSGNTYPTGGRGLEKSSQGYLDKLVVSERSVRLDLAASIGIDQIRILTVNVPEPTTLLLLGSGLILLAGLSRKKFFK